MLQKEPDIYTASWNFTFIFSPLLVEIKSIQFLMTVSAFLTVASKAIWASWNLTLPFWIWCLLQLPACWSQHPDRWGCLDRGTHSLNLEGVHSEGRLALLICGIPPTGLSLPVYNLGAQPPNSTTRLCLAELSKERWEESVVRFWTEFLLVSFISSWLCVGEAGVFAQYQHVLTDLN